MRAFILTLALSIPFALTGCEPDAADAVDDRGDAIEDAYDDAADDMEEQGDAIEEAYDDQADAIEEAYEEGAPAGDREDVIGDGEIIDEEGEPDADMLGQ